MRSLDSQVEIEFCDRIVSFNLMRAPDFMSEVVIQTENLKLRLQSTEKILAWVESLSPADKAPVSPDWLARVRTSTAADPWTHGFSLVERTSGAVIGSWAYKEGSPGSRRSR